MIMRLSELIDDRRVRKQSYLLINIASFSKNVNKLSFSFTNKKKVMLKNNRIIQLQLSGFIEKDFPFKTSKL